jgi:hypothetical protein
MTPFPTLRTPRLQLRELVTQDAQGLELEVLGCWRGNGRT